MRRQYALVVAAGTLIMIAFYGHINYRSPNYSRWDLKYYLAIAKASPQIDPTVPPPFAHRILGPYIAGLLPISPETGLYILAAAASLFLSLFFYSLLVSTGIAPPVAAISTILLVCNRYFFGFPIWDYFQVNDILLLMAISLSFYALFKDKWLLLMVSLLFGALARETILLMIPVPFLNLIEKGTFRRNFPKALAATIPALLALIILRILIPVPGIGAIGAFTEHSGKIMSPGFWYGTLINAAAPYSLLPLIFWKETLLFFKERKCSLIFLIIVFVSVLFGSNNERLMAPTFVVFYWLIAAIIQKYIYPDRLSAVFLIGLGFISSFSHESGLYRLPDRAYSLIIPFAALCLITLMAIWRKSKNIVRPLKI